MRMIYPPSGLNPARFTWCFEMSLSAVCHCAGLLLTESFPPLSILLTP